MPLAVVEYLPIVVGRAAGILLLFHGDPGDGGAGEAVVLQAEIEQLLGKSRSS